MLGEFDMKGYLFVGGPADGKRLVVDDRFSIRIPIIKTTQTALITNTAQLVDISEVEYLKYTFGTENGPISIYVPRDFTREQIIKKLIENYCPIFKDTGV